MEQRIVYMLEAANLAANAAQSGEVGLAVHWYTKAEYWARKAGDGVAAFGYMVNALACYDAL